MKRAMSAKQALSQKKELIAFSDQFRNAFGAPERCGTWFVWGQSGNGKSSFVMQLAKELARTERVLYVSREEGTSLSFQEQLKRHNMADVGRNFLISTDDTDDLIDRLRKRRAPRVVIIDSLQFMDMDYNKYKEIVEEFPHVLFIFISQVRGKKPDGRTANRIQHAAMLKVFVEGYRAISNGRFFGELGYMNIWEEGATLYWEGKQK